MKTQFLLIALIVAGVGFYLAFIPSSGQRFELEEGYSLLYDGRSLTGWRVIGGESTFAADGESILGVHGPGKNTFLRTEKTYKDFNLRMQMRWDEPGNSGVLFRANQRDGDGRAYGYQYELDHSKRAWSGGIYDEARRGWLATLEHNEQARKAIRLDTWNDVEIEAVGASLKAWVNGVPTASIVDALDAEGFIALQVHSGDIGVIRWRNIRIKELSGQSKPGDSLFADDWVIENLADVVVTDTAVSGLHADGAGLLSSRRRFTDAAFYMTVTACEQPMVVRIRQDNGEMYGHETFAQVSVYSDRALGRLADDSGVVQMEDVKLNPGASHRLTAVSVGGDVTITVGEIDVMRVTNTSLRERGRLQIMPAKCGEQFQLANLRWMDLRENSEQASFYKTLDTAPAPVLSPEQALQAFRIAPGFEIELVAAEPLVEDPVAMAWDEHNRLYVVEMRGYMPDAYGTGSEEPVGRVVRLEDTDSDGRMDSSEVFLDGLVNPRAIAVVNDGVLIAEPPQLWLCQLPGRDTLCSNKRSVGAYAHDTSSFNVEHMENGLFLGLDNWLYNAKSNRRLKLVNGEMRQQQGPFRGQWGISKDDYGRLFYNHNSAWLQADYFHAEDLIVPSRENHLTGVGVNLVDLSQVFSVRVNPGVNRAYLEDTLRPDGRLFKATGVSSLTVYRGDQFPRRYKGQVFIPESAANVIAQFALNDDGLEISAQQQLYQDEQWGQRDFLGSTDERFRPVNAANGPDGALYVVDMYRGIIQDDYFLTEELREQIFQRGLDKPIGKGRIWRIRYNNGKTKRAFPNLAKASNTELVNALQHENGWVRDTAQRLLLAKPGASREQLVQLAINGDSVPALHAIWTLEGQGELEAGLLLKLIDGGNGDPQRQIHALRAGRSLLTAEQLIALEEKLDGNESVALQYAFALGSHAYEPSVRQTLIKILAKHQGSVYVRQAVVRAVLGQELSFLRELFEGDRLSVEAEDSRAFLSALATSAYRSIRSDLSSTEVVDPALLELLSLIKSRRDAQSWQQLALLEGFKDLPLIDGFVAAHFESVPLIFSDSSVSGNDPVWDARMAARPAFTWPGDELVLGIKPLSPEQVALMQKGKAYYPNCANCHGRSGAGTPGLAPPLAGTRWVTGPPEWLGRIILQGMSGPLEVNGEQWNGVMPPHGHLRELDNETLAGLMTFLRRSWGNNANPVSIEEASNIRDASANRKRPWTAEEILTVPYRNGEAINATRK